MRTLIQHPRFRRHLSQGWKFMVVGGTGAAIDLGTQRLFVYEGFSPYTATILSTLIAVTWVFLLNRVFTFRSKGKVEKEGSRFALVYGVSIVANILITSGLVWLGVHYTLGKIIAIGACVSWNYLMSHSFVFRSKQHPEDIEVVVA